MNCRIKKMDASKYRPPQEFEVISMSLKQKNLFKIKTEHNSPLRYLQGKTCSKVTVFQYFLKEKDGKHPFLPLQRQICKSSCSQLKVQAVIKEVNIFLCTPKFQSLPSLNFNLMNVTLLIYLFF